MGRVELNGGQGTSCSTVPVWARATASGSGPSIFNYVSHCSVHRDHGVQPAHHKCSHAAELGWQWLLSFASGDRRAPRPGTDRPQWQQRPWFELEVSGIKMQFITGEVERDAHTHTCARRTCHEGSLTSLAEALLPRNASPGIDPFGLHHGPTRLSKRPTTSNTPSAATKTTAKTIIRTPHAQLLHPLDQAKAKRQNIHLRRSAAGHPTLVHKRRETGKKFTFDGLATVGLHKYNLKRRRNRQKTLPSAPHCY